MKRLSMFSQLSLSVLIAIIESKLGILSSAAPTPKLANGFFNSFF